MTSVRAVDGEPSAGAAGGVKVVDRIAVILTCFATMGPELGIGELSRATGMSKGTIHRLLGALEQHRFVDQNPTTRQYRLGLRLFELGSLAVAQVDLVGVSQPYLRSLAAETGESAHLGVVEDHMVLYVAKVEGWHSLRMPSQVGHRIPLHCTALGKVLLAHMSQQQRDQYLRRPDLQMMTTNTMTRSELLRAELTNVLQNGFAVDNEELEVGLRCVAAPIRDYSGNVVAAVSVSGPTTRITVAKTSSLAERVVKAATAISERLGGTAD